jgi:hypothetical protein
MPVIYLDFEKKLELKTWKNFVLVVEQKSPL